MSTETLEAQEIEVKLRAGEIPPLPVYDRIKNLSRAGIINYTIPMKDFTIDDNDIRRAVRIITNYLNDMSVYERYIDEAYRRLLNEDSIWILNKGEYAGTLPKRYARIVKSITGENLPPEVLGKVGSTLKKDAAYNDIRFDITTDFTWRAGEYGDSGACFMRGGCRQETPGIMRDNGAYAIRFYNSDNNGIARAWIMPYKDFIVLFNSYGYSLIKTVRILSLYLGLLYNRIGLENCDSTTGWLWINDGVGYIISSEVTDINHVDLKIYYKYSCEDCDEVIEDDDYIQIDGNYYCQECIDNHFTLCDYHNGYVYNDNASYMESYGGALCNDCLSDHFFECHQCESYYHNDDSISVERYYYCPNCYDAIASECYECGNNFLNDNLEEFEGDYYCEDCYDKLVTKCYDCEDAILKSDAMLYDGEYYCQACYEALESSEAIDEIH